jgi:hypothetical protein
MSVPQCNNEHDPPRERLTVHSTCGACGKQREAHYTLQAAPGWTKERPAESGWYWWKNKEGVCIVQVSNFHNRPLTAFMVTGRREELLGLDGEWSGPLVSPGERT